MVKKKQDISQEELDFLEDLEEEEREIELNMLRERAKKSDAITDEKWELVNKENREFVEEFLYESTHLSPKSMKQYISALRIFYFWVYENLQNKPVYNIKKQEFMRYQNSLIRRGVSSNGIKMKRSAVSSMNKYLITMYEDDERFEKFKNFVDGIKLKVTNKVYSKVPLTKEEFDLIIKTLEENEQWQILAGMHFLYSSGCRRAELLELKKEIVNYEPAPKKSEDEANIYVTHELRAKGGGAEGERRRLFFDDVAKEAIQKWLEVRGEDNSPYLFVSKYGGKINKLNINAPNYWCSEIISDIIGRRVNPHLLRGTRSTHILQDGGDLKKVQHLLGHKSSATTDQFYDLREMKEDLSDIFK